MCKNHELANMGFTDEKFPEGTHMCLIYSDEDERKKIISKFIDAGISTGEKAVYFSDEVAAEQLKNWLNDLGIKIPSDKKKESFSISPVANVYHPDGKFEPDKMLENVKNVYRDAKANHYEGARGSGEMSWALKGIPGSDRLMEYEAKLNDVLINFPVTVVYQYDANKFDGETILQCLQVHPYMIVHRQIVRNPYYMKTNDFLKLTTK